MEVLQEIKDQEYPIDQLDIKVREAARAILFDENNLIPLLFVSKLNYHKLPGGGIDKGEDEFMALDRECKEEIGCEIEIQGEVGEIIEFRSERNLKQTSYCYYGKIISKGSPDFTESELNKGFKLTWVTLAEAVARISSDQPEDYEGRFIRKRDLIFLKKFLKIAPQGRFL